MTGPATPQHSPDPANHDANQIHGSAYQHTGPLYFVNGTATFNGASPYSNAIGGDAVHGHTAHGSPRTQRSPRESHDQFDPRVAHSQSNSAAPHANQSPLSSVSNQPTSHIEDQAAKSLLKLPNVVSPTNGANGNTAATQHHSLPLSHPSPDNTPTFSQGTAHPQNTPHMTKPIYNYSYAIDPSNQHHSMAPSHTQAMTVSTELVFSSSTQQQASSEAPKARTLGNLNEAPKISNISRTAIAARKFEIDSSDDITQTAKAMLRNSSSTIPDVDHATQERIEREMRHMIEKMREYKAQAPGIFSEIWEQVKKGKPPPQNSNDVAIRSPPQQNPITATLARNQSNMEATEDTTHDVSQITSSSAQETTDFDRGKYPMHRRKRGNKFYTPDVRAKSHHKKLDRKGSGNTVDNSTLENSAASSERRPGQGDLTVPVVLMSTAHQAASLQTSMLPPVGQTYWPEDKKLALAIETQRILTSNPANAGHQISAAFIHSILNRGPSFDQLYEYLKADGWGLDRADLAQRLLAAVPIPRPIASSPMISNSEHNHIPIEASRTKHGPDRLLKTTQPQHALIDSPSHDRADRPFASNKTDSMMSDARSQIPTLATQGLKRSHKESVDLNHSVEDEDSFRHQPRPKSVHATHPNTESITNIAAMSNRNFPAVNVKAKSTSRPSFKTSRKAIERQEIIKPMQQRRDAWRRSTYEPQTICRDILISSGRHPNLPALNAHLLSLLKFDSINVDSDLHTIRWDVLDPGGPRAMASATENIHYEQHENEPTSHGSAVSPLRMRPAIALSIATKTAGQMSPPRKRGRPSKIQPLSPLSSKPSIVPSSKTNRSSQPEAAFPTLSLFCTPPPSVPNAPISEVPLNLTAKDAVQTPRRRGRPRKDKSLSAKGKRKNSPVAGSNVSSRNSRQHSVSKSTPTRHFTAGQSAAPTPAAGFAVIIPSPSSSKSKSKSTEKATLDNDFDAILGHSRASSQVPQSSYRVYKCLWEGCPSELHDQRILQKHVYKQHRERQGNAPWPCRWLGCPTPERTLLFYAAKDWELHMNTIHLGVPQMDMNRHNEHSAIDAGTTPVSDAKRNVLDMIS